MLSSILHHFFFFCINNWIWSESIGKTKDINKKFIYIFSSANSKITLHLYNDRRRIENKLKTNCMLQ